jgi:hypothetical protein
MRALMATPFKPRLPPPAKHYLNANRDCLAAGKPPRFVNPRRDAELTPFLIVKRPAETNSQAHNHAAFAVGSGNSFIL